MRFESICLICVAILAAGEEHNHLNDSTSEALVDNDQHCFRQGTVHIRPLNLALSFEDKLICDGFM